MGSVGGRIKRMIAELGLPVTQTSLAERMGVVPNTVRGYLERDVLTTDTLEKLAEALTDICADIGNGERFTAASLLEGREDVPLRPSAAQLMHLGGAEADEIAKVFAPCYGNVPCGQPIELDEPPLQMVDLTDLTSNAYRPGECYLLRAEGASMEPLIRAGDWLVVNRNQAIGYQQIGVFLYNGQTTVKRLIAHPDSGRPALKPENPNESTIEIGESDELECQGVVVAWTRTFRGS